MITKNTKIIIQISFLVILLEAISVFFVFNNKVSLCTAIQFNNLNNIFYKLESYKDYDKTSELKKEISEVITTNYDSNTWNVYKDESLKFEIKYPNKYKIEEDNSLSKIIFILKNTSKDFGISIEKQDKDLELNYKNIIEKNNQYYFVKNNTFVNSKEITQLKGQYNRIWTYFEYKDYYYCIKFLPNVNMDVDEYNALLLTFKII